MAPRSAPIAPVVGDHTIITGVCRITADSDGNGWMVDVNGVQSSHVALDPARLDFEYMRWMAAAITQWQTTRIPATSLRVMHLGAGAATMPRYLLATYPHSRHLAVDIDPALAELVREQFSLPRAPLLRLRAADARDAVTGAYPGSRDLVIVDAFAGARTPTHLRTVEFFTAIRAALASQSLVLMNCADTRDLTYARRQIATIATVFPHIAIIADPAMLKGRRYGNVVIAGSDVPIDASATIVRELLSDGVPASIIAGDEAIAFARNATPLVDNALHESN